MSESEYYTSECTDADLDAQADAGTLKPTALLAMFSAPQLEPVAQEVEDTIIKIMKDATTG